MTIPDDNTIRQLDGPALTRLAYDLGLAPAGATLWNEQPYAHRDFWEPHKDVSQARALFFGISGLWKLYSQGTRGTAGEVHLKDEYGTELAGVSWGLGSDEPSEALALLRCACRARAAQLREEA